MEVYIIIGIAIVVVLLLMLMLNSFIKLNNHVNEAFATMDVYLKKRWDLIPNLVETVKVFAKYEKETLEEVIKMDDSILPYLESSYGSSYYKDKNGKFILEKNGDDY